VSSARAKGTADLGFDPTITCTTVDSATTRQYEIKVSDNKDGPQESIGSGNPRVRTFITQRIIANYRAVGIRSRSTWVFEGSEAQQPGDTLVVIKDVWIDADREVEGTILENVREALKDTPEELQLFLEPLCHGCVLINGVKDLTQPLLKSKGTMSLTYSGTDTFSLGTSGARKRTVEGLSLGSTPNLPTEEPVVIGRRGDRRKHYRIVFKGKAGHALHDLESHRDVFTGLLGGVKGMFGALQYPRSLTCSNPALHALHKAGYIHRDLSAGNVLLVNGAEGEDCGVLIDLECAKRFPDTSQEGHDVRTVSSYVLFWNLLTSSHRGHCSSWPSK
jgi:Fungal protein kinase